MTTRSYDLVIAAAAQQAGGAVGLAVIGSVAWSVVIQHARSSFSGARGGHVIAVAPARGPIYDHARPPG